MATGTLHPSSAPAPRRGAPPIDAERFIDRQIDRTGKYVKTVDVLGGVLTLFAATLAFFLAVVAIDHWVLPGGLGTLGRSIVLVTWLTATGAYLVRKVAPPLLRRVNPLYAATTIEQTSDSFKNSLVTSLELRENRQGVDETIFRSVERQAAGTLRTVPVEASVDRSGLIRVGYVLAALVFAAALYKLVSPKDPLQTLLGVAAPWADVAPATRVFIQDVRPGDTAAVLGSRVQVSAEVTGLEPDEPVTLRYSSVDGQLDRVPVAMAIPDGDFRHACSLPPGAGLTQDVVYWIEAGDARSAEFRVTVESAPTITVDAIGYNYQDYTYPSLRDNPRDTRSADIQALEGTKVTIHAVANQPIASAQIDFHCDGKGDQRMTVRGERAEATFTLDFADREKRKQRFEKYQIIFTNKQGHTNAQPAQHTIKVVPDLPPEVEFLAPAKPEIAVAENATAQLEVRAIDPDFKLGDVRIIAAVENGRALVDESLLSDGERPSQGQFIKSYPFVPRKHNLKAGDVVIYSALARDNRTPDANQASTAKFNEFRIRIVAPPEPQKKKEGAPDEKKPNDPDKKPDEKQEQKPDEQQKPDDRQKSDKQKPGDSPKQPGGENSEKKGGEQPGENGEKGEQGEKRPGSKNEGQPDEQQSPDNKGSQEQTGSKDQSGDQGAQSDSKTKGGQPSPSKDARSGNDNTGGDKQQQPDQQGGNEQPGGGAGEGAPSAQQQRGPGSTHGQRESTADDGEAFEELLKDKSASEAKGKSNKSDSAQPDGAASQDTSSESAKTKGDVPQKESTRPDDANATDANPDGEKAEKGGPREGVQGEAKPDRESTPDGKSGKGLGEKKIPGQEDKSTESGQAKPEESKNKKPSDEAGKQEKGGQGNPGAADEGKPSDNTKGAPEKQDTDIPSTKPSTTDDNRKESKDDDVQSPGQSKRQSKGTQGEVDGDRAGGGGKGGGESANQAGKDAAGSNTSSNEGANKSNERGKGETGSKAGPDQQSDKKTGESGSEKGDGSSSRKGDSSSSSSKSRGPGDGEKGEGTGREGDGPQGNGTGPGKDNVPVKQTEPAAPDKPNLEYSEKATDLALDHLRDRMKQGNERELLEKLGWTRADADQFLRKWEQLKREAKGNDASAENARKRLQEDLKSLGLRSGGDKARRADAAKDDRRGLATGTSVPPPPEYRDRLRAYQKGTGEAGPTATRGE